MIEYSPPPKDFIFSYLEEDGGSNEVSDAGRSLKRFEDPRLLKGRGSFVDDIRLPDMLYAHVLRSPMPMPSSRPSIALRPATCPAW